MVKSCQQLNSVQWTSSSSTATTQWQGKDGKAVELVVLMEAVVLWAFQEFGGPGRPEEVVVVVKKVLFRGAWAYWF